MVNPVRSGLPGQDATTRLLYRPASWVFSLPDKVEGVRDKFVTKSDKGKGLAKFLGKLMDWDFRDFQGKIANAPLGAACFLFFGAMMSSRLYRAWKRGKENGNDFREVKDILWRDSIAISLFVFGLNTLTKLFNNFYQKLPGTGGLKLFDPLSKEVLSYSRFANYRLDSERALISLIREGGGEGLKLAMRKLYQGGLCEVGGEPVKQHLDAILEKLPGLIEKVKATPLDDAKGQAEVTALAQDVYKHLQAGDGLLKELLESAQKTGLKQVVKTARKVQGTFENAVIKYAQSRRLPADILGFALVVLMLGWFPGWFNAQRNKRNFEREQKQGGGNQLPAAGYNPYQTLLAMQQASRLQMAQQRAARLAQHLAPQNQYNPFQPSSPWQQAVGWPQQYNG